MPHSMRRTTRISRPKLSSATTPSHRIQRSMEEPKLDIPPIDCNSRYWYFTHRHDNDKKYADEQYDEIELINCNKRSVKPCLEIASREPSYTKFKVPFQMICQERYSRSVKQYDEQFCREINNQIDNQPTAREATYFVRIVSYTTLWPPYHNEREMIDTSRRFYAMTPQELSRFQKIMARDY